MRFFAIFLCLLCLGGCAFGPSPDTEETVPVGNFPALETGAETQPPEPPLPPVTEAPAPDPLQTLLESLTIEERVGQLFLIRCDSNTALQDISTYHPAGFMLFGRDFQDRTPDSLRRVLSDYQAASQIPLLLAVDEEGGTVTRISRYPAFQEAPFSSPRAVYNWGGMEKALENEDNICKFLSELGLNVNLGPVCDISTDPKGFMYQRSLGQDADTTSEFIAGTVEIMAENRIGSVLKHFPGYGNNADTHIGIAVDSRSLEEFQEHDLKPFAAGIQAGCGAVLVSHTIVEALDPEAPASLSPAAHRYLREEMGFDGVIMTDDLVMEAITDLYGAGEAAVLAVLAGNDLLCSTDYSVQYRAVMDAVLSGRIDFDLLNEAVRRVLAWKMDLGLL